jgi:DNA-binding CsgD family transcriptional regulator/tetratricopeptide (TPR) repeat protein
VQLEWPLVGRDRDLGQIATLLRDGTTGGVVLIGPGGVGKTRLATECLVLAERDGFATARAVATRASSHITLGALAPLLPNLGEGSINFLNTARQALRDRAGDKRLVLMVDDAHLLDDASASLVMQIAADREVFVLATVRTGEDVSDAILELWKNGHALRVDVKPLGEDELDHLIDQSLGDGIGATTHVELRRISRGNPLALRELILGAVESGSLAQDDDGRWSLVGPLHISERLADLVEERLGSLDAAESEAVEFVALGEPVAVDVLERLARPEAIESIERKGLIDVRSDDGRLEAWLDHPLFGEVLRANVGTLRTRNVLRSLADALEASDVKRGGDLLRLATWRLESGSRAEPELLLAAARQAMAVNDTPLTCRICEASWAAAPSIEVGGIYSYALCDLGQFDEADAVLTAAADLVQRDEDRVMVTSIRAELLFRTGRAQEALDLESSELEHVDDPVWRAVFVAHRATFVMLMGRTQEALDDVRPSLGADAGLAETNGASIVAGTILTWDGRPDDAIAVHERAYARCVQAQAEDAFNLQDDAGIQLVGVIQALTQAGRLAEADEMLAAAWRAVAEQHSTVPMAWISLQYALLRTEAGRPADALRWARISTELWRSSGLYGRMRWPQGVATLALATLGRSDDAQQQLTMMDAIETPVRFNEAGIDDSRVWVLAASGSLEDARSACRGAADLGVRMGQRTCAVTALYSLARLGAPNAALEPMQALRPELQGRLLLAKADHVESLAAGDGDRLLDVSREMADIGASLFAAEAAADAARAYRKDGRSREGTAAAQRSRVLADECEGARTPALALTESTSPLTRREREVAMLAAQGMASKAIAERLYLSVRTVDNHLSRAYEKLGVTGRDDLVAVADRI